MYCQELYNLSVDLCMEHTRLNKYFEMNIYFIEKPDKVENK